MRIFLTSGMAVIASSVALAQNASPPVYQAPRLSECASPNPLVSPQTGGDRQPAPAPEQVPWTYLTQAVSARPSDAMALIDLSRCYLSFYSQEDSLEERRLGEARNLIARALEAVRRSGPEVTGAPEDRSTVGEPTLLRMSGALPERTQFEVPQFPEAARRSGRGGVVFLDLILATDGKVREARIVGSVPEFDKAATAAVRKWRYKPTVVAGKPVEVAKLVGVRFQNSFSAVTDHLEVARFFQARGEPVAASAALGDAMAAVDEDIEADRPFAGVAPLHDARVRTPPKLIKDAKPSYTEQALRAKLQGDVYLRVVVGVDGRVTAGRVITSVDRLYGLDNSALAAALQWRFSPAIDTSGQPIPVAVRISLQFRIF